MTLSTQNRKSSKPLAIEVADTIDPRIDCARCEAVCCRLPVLLMPDDRVARWLTEYDEYGLERMRQSDDGWCVALDRDTMRCTIYAHRPGVCAEFAMGGGGCREERAAWYGDAIDVAAARD